MASPSKTGRNPRHQMKPPKPVKSFKHISDKRAHIPSAEEAGYEAQSQKVLEAGAIELPLNPVITRGQDPELFWMHKYPSDAQLTVQLDDLQTKLKANDTAGARTALELLRDTITHRYEQPEDESLHVDIRSLYRHEHIAPETVIKGLYRLVAEQSKAQGELFTTAELFGNAIGHEELDKVSSLIWARRRDYIAEHGEFTDDFEPPERKVEDDWEKNPLED